MRGIWERKSGGRGNTKKREEKMDVATLKKMEEKMLNAQIKGNDHDIGEQMEKKNEMDQMVVNKETCLHKR